MMINFVEVDDDVLEGARLSPAALRTYRSALAMCSPLQQNL